MHLPLRRATLCIAASLLVLLFTSQAKAQVSGTWINAGSSTWSTLGNWSGGVPDGGGVATFNSLTGQTGNFTVTMDSTSRTLSGITWDTPYGSSITASGGATLGISGGSLTLNAINSFKQNQLSPNTFGYNTLTAPIVGNGDLIKTGNGAITLGVPISANTFTGTVRVNQGDLYVSGGDAVFGNALNGIDINGGRILSGTNVITTSRTINIGASGGTLVAYSNLTLNGSLTGSGTLVKQVNTVGTLFIGGNASGFTGIFRNETGATTMNGTASFGGTAIVDNGGTLTLDNATTNTANRLGGRTLVSRAGTLILTGNSTTAVSETFGGLTLQQGLTVIQATVTAATPQGVSLNLGTITRNNNSTLFLNGTNMNSAAAAGNATFLSGNLSGSLIGAGGASTSTTASILPWGYGNEIVAGANTGSTWLTQGVGGQLVGLNITSGYNSNILTATATENVSQSVSAALTGNTTINSLRMVPTANMTLSNSGLTTITSGGVLFTGSAATVTSTISSNITAGANELVLISTSGQTTTTASTTAGLSITGVISGSGGLTRAGSGTMLLGNANTYTGSTTLVGGITIVGTSTLTSNGSAASAFGQDTSDIQMIGSAGSTRLYTSGNLTINRNIVATLGSAGSSGFIALGVTRQSTNESLVVNGNLTLNTPNPDSIYKFFALEGGTSLANAVTINGVISGAGGLRSNSGLYAVLNNTNTYTGGTQIGTAAFATATGVNYQALSDFWQISADNAFGTGGISWLNSTPQTTFPMPGQGTIISAGSGTRTLTNDITFVGNMARFDGTTPLVLSGTMDLNSAVLGNTSINTVSAATQVTMSGTVTRGGLVKDGAGTLILSGSNTYTGVTIIRNGVLSVSTIGNGGVAGNLGGAPTGSTYLQLTGNAVGTNGTLRYTGAGETTNRSILFNGSGGTIDSSGAGALVFSGPTSFAMATPVGSGTGITGVSVNALTSIISISTGNTSGFVVGSTVSNGNIPVGTTITEVGVNYIRLSALTTNAAAATGQTLVTTLPAGLTSRVITLTGSNTGLNTINPNIGNATVLPISLAKTGVGTWVIGGTANTYTGTTVVNGGNLIVNGSNTAATTGTYTVNNGGTLSGTGNLASTAGGAVTVNSGGTLSAGTAATPLGTLNTRNITINSGGNVNTTLDASGTPGTSSRLNVQGASSIMNWLTGSRLNLTALAGFPSSAPGLPDFWRVASLVDGNNIQLDGASVADGQVLGSINTGGASGPVVISLVSGFNLTGTEHIFLQRQANDLVLVYLPVPEPGLLFGAAMAVLGAGAVIRRRFAR